MQVLPSSFVDRACDFSKKLFFSNNLSSKRGFSTLRTVQQIKKKGSVIYLEDA